jgi:CXXC-20-CXXC protein
MILLSFVRGVYKLCAIYRNQKYYRKMEKCKKCKTTLSSKSIFKSLWKGYKNFSCANCQTQYEFNPKDRLIVGIVIGISTFLSSFAMNYSELEIVSKLILGLFLMAFSCIVLSALSISFLTFQLNKK